MTIGKTGSPKQIHLTLLGHVHENYNADDGMGCDVRSSDKFYHWGVLLTMIALMEVM